MSEFKEVVTVKLPAEFCLTKLIDHEQQTKQDFTVSSNAVPKGSKLLELQMGADSRGAQAEVTKPAKKRRLTYVNHQLESSQGDKVVKFGIYRDPIDFLTAAIEAEHPLNSLQALTDRQASMLAELMQRSKHEVKAYRISTLARMENRQRELENKKDLHEAMPARIRKITEGKNILLTKELMKEAGIPNQGLMGRMVAGFELLGELQETGLFPRQFNPPRISKKELMRSALVSQKEAMKQCASSGDRDIDVAVYDKTIKEESAGWILPPMTKEEAVERAGKLFVVNRRFGIKQGRGEKVKIRQIDDMSAFLPKATVGQPEKLELGGVHELVVLIKSMEEISSGNMKSHECQDGSVIDFKCHPGWKDRLMLRGRT